MDESQGRDFKLFRGDENKGNKQSAKPLMYEIDAKRVQSYNCTDNPGRC
jgi:hypothetical protein